MSSSLSLQAAIPVDSSAAVAVAWRFKGELRISAVVKASFAFADDAPMTRQAPQPILFEDVHQGGNRLRSIVAANDLAPYKKRADVVFTGCAYAPSPGTESLTVRLGLADGERTLIDKALLLKKKGGFSKLRLAYEHAAGGPGRDENPFGEDDRDSDDLYVFLPGAGAAVAAGLAPLPRNMAPRKALLGALPMPLLGPEAFEIPASFPFEAFQIAPADQMTEHLRGHETVSLDGLSAKAPRLRMRLPNARGAARIFGLADHGIQDGKPLAMYLDTLHVSGDDEKCHATWRGAFAVRGDAPLESVRIAVGVELFGEPLAWPDAAAIRAIVAADARIARGAPDAGRDATLPLSGPLLTSVQTGASKKRATLPFSHAAPGAPARLRAERRPPPSAAGQTLAVPTQLEGAPKPSTPFGANHTPKAVAPSPPAPAVTEAAPAPLPAEEATKAGSPWALPPELERLVAPPRARKKKLPPRVDVMGKLYGSSKKAR